MAHITAKLLVLRNVKWEYSKFGRIMKSNDVWDGWYRHSSFKLIIYGLQFDVAATELITTTKSIRWSILTTGKCARVLCCRVEYIAHFHAEWTLWPIMINSCISIDVRRIRTAYSKTDQSDIAYGSSGTSVIFIKTQSIIGNPKHVLVVKLAAYWNHSYYTYGMVWYVRHQTTKEWNGRA